MGFSETKLFNGLQTLELTATSTLFLAFKILLILLFFMPKYTFLSVRVVEVAESQLSVQPQQRTTIHR